METKLQKSHVDSLNKSLLKDAERLIQHWTGHETELSGDELKFINITRQDGELGSCSINLVTGEFNDFAASGQFKGCGMVALYTCIHKCNESESYDALKNAVSQNQGQGFVNSKFKNRPDKPKHIAVPVSETDANVVSPPDIHPELGIPDMQWAYKLSDGSVAFYVYRFNQMDGKKETRPVSYSANEKRWLWKYPQNPLPLYGGDRLDMEQVVVVVEGEKACDAAQRQFPDHICVTSAKGSNQAFDSNWRGLADKDAIIVPDNDLPGREYAMAVTALAVVAGAKSVSIKDVRQLGWATGDDLADHEVTFEFLNDSVNFVEALKPAEFEASLVRAASQLELGEFDRQQIRLAATLGVSVNTFKKLVKQARRNLDGVTTGVPDLGDQLVEPNPEPWEGDVDTAQLYRSIKSLAQRHVVMTEAQATTVALWVMYTYIFEALPQSPILLLTSASPRCGKTTLLDLIGGLVSRCMSTSNISTAAIYRSIELAKPTLLVDEADTFLSGNHEAAGVLNSGHTKRSAFITRVEKVGDQLLPKRFSTFCPKCVAMIDLPKSAALLDRCLLIRLERALSTERPVPLPYDIQDAYGEIRRRLVKWAAPILEDGIDMDLSLLPYGKNARAHGNWSVLATVAQTADEDIVKELRKAVDELADTDLYGEDLAKDLLSALATIFFENLKLDRFAEAVANPLVNLNGNHDLVASSQLIKKLNDLKHMSWADFNGGKGITERGVARQLKPFGIRPQQARVNAQVTRGYRVGQFVSVWDRYDIKLPDHNRSGADQKNIVVESLI